MLKLVYLVIRYIFKNGRCQFIAGMARAKAQGKRISRPALPIQQQQEIFELQNQGLSMNKISKQLGIAYGTVYNYVGKLKT